MKYADVAMREKALASSPKLSKLLDKIYEKDALGLVVFLNAKLWEFKEQEKEKKCR